MDSADDNDHHFRANETYPLSVAYNATSPDPTTDQTAHSLQLLLHVGPTPMVMNWQATPVRAPPPAPIGPRPARGPHRRPGGDPRGAAAGCIRHAGPRPVPRVLSGDDLRPPVSRPRAHDQHGEGEHRV